MAEALLFYIAVVITRSQMEKQFSSKGSAVLLDVENRLVFFYHIENFILTTLKASE